MDNSYTIGGVVIAPLIVGIVNKAKEAGVPSRFAGLLSILLSLVIYVAWSLIQGAQAEQFFINVLLAIYVGLAASGGYSTVKSIKE